MRQQLYLTVAAMAVVVTAWLAYNRDVTDTSSFGVSYIWQYEMVPIENGSIGPESFAFDPHGEGPYTGVSDGRIIKWNRRESRWVDFAVTSSHRLTLSTSLSHTISMYTSFYLFYFKKLNVLYYFFYK
jgi:hypothetical protein